QQPLVPMFSTVTGGLVGGGELNAGYWWRNMRQPVQFRAAIDAAIEAGCDTFLELGAHPVLAGPVRSCLAHHGREGLVVGTLHRDQADQTAMMKAVAELHVGGVPVNWKEIVPKSWNFVKLPGQTLEKSPLWAEAEESRALRLD